MCPNGLIDFQTTYLTTNIIGNGALKAILWKETSFYGGHFGFMAGTVEMTSCFPRFLNSVYSKTPYSKFSCFYPEVHKSAKNCYISALLHFLRFKMIKRYIVLIKSSYRSFKTFNHWT